MRARTLVILLGSLAIALSAVVAVLGWPFVEPTSVTAVERRLNATHARLIVYSGIDDSTGTLYVEVATSATPGQVRALWCRTVGHAAIAQGLPIDVSAFERPRDCGLVDDGTARVIVIGGLLVLAGCLMTLGPLVPPFLPATLAVAAVSGACFAIVLGDSEHVRSMAGYVGMAIIEVVGGAFAMAFGMATIESLTTGQPFEPMVMVFGGIVGLFAFGIPAFVATGTHVTIWRALLIPAVDARAPKPGHVVGTVQPV